GGGPPTGCGVRGGFAWCSRLDEGIPTFSPLFAPNELVEGGRGGPLSGHPPSARPCGGSIPPPQHHTPRLYRAHATVRTQVPLAPRPPIRRSCMFKPGKKNTAPSDSVGRSSPLVGQGVSRWIAVIVRSGGIPVNVKRTVAPMSSPSTSLGSFTG